MSPHMILANPAGHTHLDACECREQVSENEGNQLSLLQGLTLCGVSVGATLIRLLLSCGSLAADACAPAPPEIGKKILSAQLF